MHERDYSGFLPIGEFRGLQIWAVSTGFQIVVFFKILASRVLGYEPFRGQGLNAQVNAELFGPTGLIG